jgi:hypothetical protein
MSQPRQIVDFAELTRHLTEDPIGPEAYAPPVIRGDDTVKEIRTFGALPTTELDEIVSAAKAEIASLEADAQAVRDLYVKHTERIAAGIKRLREGVRLSMDTMKQLREQCEALDKEETSG